MLPLLPDQSSAFGTFPGENGKIAFQRQGDVKWKCYQHHIMDADGNGETRLTNNPAYDTHPDWSPDSI